MKRALIIATVSGFVPQFEMNNVHLLQELGYQVHYASNFHNPHYGLDNHRLDGSGIILHQIDFMRSPFCIRRNFCAYRQLQRLFDENSFDLVHCHTPVGGVLGRLAVRNYRKKQKWKRINKQIREIRKKNRKELEKGEQKENEIKVIYTAHGFHFFRGASIVNWMLYYPIERWLAHDTDILVTINEEDYQNAKKFRLREEKKKQTKNKKKNKKQEKKRSKQEKPKQVWKVNGVGIEIENNFSFLLNREEKRREFGIPKDAYVFLSVGELSKRKNHQIVIKALDSIKEICRQKKIYYLICGEGSEHSKLLQLIKRRHLEFVRLLGYRTDIKELLSVADCFIFPSKQEGLPVALMEALAVGLPCICSDIRGNIDLADEGDVQLFHKKSIKQCKRAILEMIYQGRLERRSFLNSQYEKKEVQVVMQKIYHQAGEKYGKKGCSHYKV